MISEDAIDGIILFKDIGKKIEQEITRLNIPVVQVNTNSVFFLSMNFWNGLPVKQ